ncbi:MAG: biopolymer transporter ExbD [Cyanothece sp. SIO1E1]|nr:biopolymer transporter ExbD [Cyanothece sp. SIO1E1]
MNINLDAPTEEVRIEIIPLIDVIFCILTFFILAAVGLTRQQAIGLDLPAAETSTPQLREMLIVSIDPIGQTYIDKQPINRNQLTQALRKYQQAQPEGAIVLYASKDARYNDVVEVLDVLRSVGGDRVALATIPEAADAAEAGAPSLNSVPGTGLQNPANVPGNLGSPRVGTPNLANPSTLPGTPNSPRQLVNPNVPRQPGVPGTSRQPGTPGASPQLRAPNSARPYNPNQFQFPLLQGPANQGSSSQGTSGSSTQPNASPSPQR